MLLTGLSTDPADLGARTLTHLLCQDAQIDTSLERHLQRSSMSGTELNIVDGFRTFREWIRKMATRASGPGGGNSIFLSMRPGRSNAASKMSNSE